MSENDELPSRLKRRPVSPLEVSNLIARVGEAIASELSLDRVVQTVTDVATELTGAEFGAFFYNVVDAQGERYTLYSLSGVDHSAFSNFPLPRNTDIFRPTFMGESVVRLHDVTQDPRYGRNAPHRGMPEGHLPVRSYLAVPVVSSAGKVWGGLFFGHSTPGMFDAEHEQMAVGIARWAAIAMDNADAYRAVRAAQEHEAARARHAALIADVALALTRGRDQQKMLQACTQSLVRHLGAAFARIWLLDESGDTLELKASSGDYTHLDGQHSRIRVGQYKIGLIAKERTPHLTNDVLGDPRVHDQEWARRSGMRAFAGYPLLVEDRLLGVMGLFSRKVLSADVLDILRGVSDAIAVGIDRLRAEQELVRANAAKDELLALVSHELRTPITVIGGTSEFLIRREGQVDAGTRRAALQDIQENSVRLHSLIENMLVLAHHETGQTTFSEPVLVQRVVLAVVQDHQRRFPEREFELDIENDLPAVVSQAMALDQVIQNLLGNAEKYSSPVEPLVITVRRHDDEVVVSITDRGPGVPHQELDLLFNPFFRSATVPTTIGGAGLGLAVCKRLIEAHGGRIWAANVPEGGLRVSFSLPFYTQPE